MPFPPGEGDGYLGQLGPVPCPLNRTAVPSLVSFSLPAHFHSGIAKGKNHQEVPLVTGLLKSKPIKLLGVWILQWNCFSPEVGLIHVGETRTKHSQPSLMNQYLFVTMSLQVSDYVVEVIHHKFSVVHDFSSQTYNTFILRPKV